MAQITGRKTTQVRASGMLVILSSVLAVFAGELNAQTPPGTVIRNLATVNYQAVTGASFTPVSDSAFVTVGSPLGIAVTLTKSVDLASGTLGDIVTYTIAYQGLGGATATNVTINDVLPAGAVYVAGSIMLNGAPLTDATGDDAGSFNAAARRVTVTLATVTGSDAGTVTFRARLDGSASPSNVAKVAYTTPSGPDSAKSNAVQTTLVFSSIAVVKLLDAPVAPAIARVGDAVQYRIRYANPASSVVARNVIVTDTLPAFLQYVGSVPAATVSGSVLTWTLGDIASGATADITVQTRVAATLPDSMTVINRANLALDNGPAVSNSAPPVLLLLAGTGQLTLGKAADVLEAGLGETVPYTLTIQNVGTTALSDFRIVDHLPDGGRYARGSTLGADSAVVNGSDVTFYVAGPVAAGATFRVRYRVAVVSARSDVLQNTAIATAEAGTIQTPPATAWVRIRSNWPLETRAVIGRVFVDANRSGQQDDGEAGVAGVDVWTDDGEIATTDAEGRFSFQNLRPGRHVYRIDAATLPIEYVADGATQFVVRDGSGWTSPRVNFGLHKMEPGAAAANGREGHAGSVTAAAPSASDTIPAALSPSAVATTTSVPSNAASAQAVPAQSAPSSAVHLVDVTSTPSSSVAAESLEIAAAPSCVLDGVLPGGHGDRVIIAHFEKNDARPHYAVEPEEIDRRMKAYLGANPECGVEIVGHTDSSDVWGGPFWTNQRLAEARARWVAYQLYFTSLQRAIMSVYGRAAWEPLPDVGDLGLNRRVELRMVNRRAEIPTVPLADLVAPMEPPAVLDTSPELVVATSPDSTRPVSVPTDSTRPAAVSPDSTRPEAVSLDSVRSVSAKADSTRPASVPPKSTRPDSVPADSTPPDSTPPDSTVASAQADALRSQTEHANEARRARLAGLGVSVFSPTDGTVLASDRVFVGVRGEPDMPVALFDGATMIAQGKLRADGVHDFIAIPLARGPHRLRVRMINSWGRERWDSLNVHVSGRPGLFMVDRSPAVLVTRSRDVDTLRVRVLDRWRVPVSSREFVTISAQGAEIASVDEDGSSVGSQMRTDTTGWMVVLLRGGRAAGFGTLTLRAGDARGQVPLQILPATRPLMVTATGQVGVGASPDAFGAASARGSLDSRTSVSASIDSRQLDAGREDFGRSVDPLGDAQYPILGDASTTRSRSASRYAVAARVERGLDWVAMGDLTTGAFASGLALSGYDRALSGVAGRVTSGAVVWQGFGATSSDRIAQQQIRGAGMSGPYDIGLGVRPGTERVVLETRAYDDAQQTLARQALVRYLDYQVDYERGLLLFKQPVPATDASGNPVFIMVTYGTANGGVQSSVFGLRASVDGRSIIGHARESFDSLRIGSTFIRDSRPGAERDLAGIDFGAVRAGRFALRGEIAHSQTPDSAGFATNVDGALVLANGRVALAGNWLHSDAEFRNPANIALAGGASDLKLAAKFAVGSSELRLEHSAQSFDLQNVNRSKSGAFVARQFGTLRAEAGLSANRLNTGTQNDALQAGEVKFTWSPLHAFTFQADARHHLGAEASLVQPDYVGVGVRFKVNAHTSFELNHRDVALPGKPGYSVTTLGARSDIGAGTQAWGSYQLAGVSGSHAATVVGLNNRLRFSNAWTLNTMFERRMGLNKAATGDPVRALPFTQVEEDYWSAGVGAEYLPEQKPYRFSLRSEFRDGAERSSRLVTMAGAASLSKAFALISRQEFQAADDRQPTGRINHQRLASINGLAFRPVGSDALNLLAKVEYIDERNPLGGGVLTVQTGHETRRIMTVEAIWSPAPRLELAGRFALRRADATVTHTDSVVQPLSSSADYVGSRLDVSLAAWLRVRGESRLLHERTSGTIRWDAAPQAVVIPVRGLEIAGGYRMGDLRDPDFAVRGGAGWFVTFGGTVTEQSVADLASFWRARQSQ